MKTEPLYKRFSTSRFDEYGVLCGIAFNARRKFHFAYDVVDAIAANSQTNARSSGAMSKEMKEHLLFLS